MKNYDLLIIGSGIVGSALSFYSSLQNKKVLVLEKNFAGYNSSGNAQGGLAPYLGNDLDIKKFEKLRDSSALDLIYAHFFSLNCFSVLLRLMSARKKMESNLRGLGLEIFGGTEGKMDFNF